MKSGRIGRKIGLWAGGVAESDDFFDRCDELGILVWTEFWQTGDTQIQSDRTFRQGNVMTVTLSGNTIPRDFEVAPARHVNSA